MPLSELLDRYLAIACVGASPATLRLYRLTIDRFAETIGEAAAVAHLTDEWLGRHAARRIAEGRSRHTVRGEMAKLLALWRFAARRKIVDCWPEVRPIKAPQREPRAWTQTEFNRIWRACDFATPVGDCPGPQWWRTLLLVLLDTGERIGAAMRLEWSGVEEGRVYLPAEVRKGGDRDRSYPIAPDTAAALDLLPRQGDLVFASPMCKATLYNRFSAILKRAELPADRRSKFHRIRRTHASYVAAAGGDAQKSLGHSDARTTDTYLDPRIVREPAPCDILWRPGA